MTVKLEDHIFLCFDYNILSDICQQRDGLTLCSQSNGVRKGFVLLAANCGDILAFLDTVGAICVLGRDEAVSAVAI